MTIDFFIPIIYGGFGCFAVIYLAFAKPIKNNKALRKVFLTVLGYFLATAFTLAFLAEIAFTLFSLVKSG